MYTNILWTLTEMMYVGTSGGYTDHCLPFKYVECVLNNSDGWGKTTKKILPIFINSLRPSHIPWRPLRILTNLWIDDQSPRGKENPKKQQANYCRSYSSLDHLLSGYLHNARDNCVRWCGHGQQEGKVTTEAHGDHQVQRMDSSHDCLTSEISRL